MYKMKYVKMKLVWRQDHLRWSEPWVWLDGMRIPFAVVIQYFLVWFNVSQCDENKMTIVVMFKYFGFAIGCYAAVVDQSAITARRLGGIHAPNSWVPVKVIHVATCSTQLVFPFTFLKKQQNNNSKHPKSTITIPYLPWHRPAWLGRHCIRKWSIPFWLP